MYSSLEEAFEFCWSLFPKHKPIIKQEKHKIKQTYIWIPITIKFIT